MRFMLLVIYLQFPKGLYLNGKRGTVCHTLNLKVVGKPLCTDVTIAAHACAWEPLCYLCAQMKISYVFKLQDKHNASFWNLICLEQPFAILYKISKKLLNLTLFGEFIYIVKLSIFYRSKSSGATDPPMGLGCGVWTTTCRIVPGRGIQQCRLQGSAWLHNGAQGAVPQENIPSNRWAIARRNSSNSFVRMGAGPRSSSGTCRADRAT